jgi:hypothetical protein
MWGKQGKPDDKVFIRGIKTNLLQQKIVMNKTTKTKEELLTFIVSNSPSNSLFDLEFDQQDIEMSIRALYDLSMAELVEVYEYVKQYN